MKEGYEDRGEGAQRDAVAPPKTRTHSATVETHSTRDTAAARLTSRRFMQVSYGFQGDADDPLEN